MKANPKSFNKTVGQDPDIESMDLLALKEASKEWDASQWEAHLQSIECGLKESQPSNLEIETSGLATNVFAWTSSGVPVHVSIWLKDLISRSSERQQFIIKKIFWDGMSERQIARIMGISRQGVYDLKKRAIRKLIKNASKPLAKIPLVETKANAEQNRGRSRLDPNGRDRKRNGGERGE